LKERVAEIAIIFKENPCNLFHLHMKNIEPNMLIIRIQPDEGISLQFAAKIPGKKMAIDTVRMDFCHECTFGPNSPEAYERLIFDTMSGDQTLFTRWDEVEHAWKIVDVISNAWKKNKKLPMYKAGSWGPKESDLLLKKDNREWNVPKKPSYSVLLNN